MTSATERVAVMLLTGSLELVVHALPGQDERVGRVRSGYDADARAGGQADELHLPLPP